MSTSIKVKETSFSIMPKTTEELMLFSETLSKTEIVPINFAGKPQEIFACIASGLEIGLQPIQALRSIAIINGKSCLYGDAMLALVMSSSVFDKIEESIDKENMVATCSVWRKGGTTKTVTFSKEDATTAGLWGKKGPWTLYPIRLLTMKARNYALRDVFPDVLSGMISEHEALDMPTPPPPEAETKQVEAEVITVSEQISETQTLNDLIAIYNELSEPDKKQYQNELSTRKEEIIANG